MRLLLKDGSETFLPFDVIYLEDGTVSIDVRMPVPVQMDPTPEPITFRLAFTDEPEEISDALDS